ncbi:uncharacterized protein [Nicotiana tomentosiformis]|uniref:uncharacterized protein n=1 Tax=Nicotiana tomentosiformis TaxID=4098 RepID=UPI00388CA19E
MAEEQHMAVQEVAMPNIANVTSSIVKPRITRHFELKQSMIQLLHANGQYMGLPHEDPQQHILNFLEIIPISPTESLQTMFFPSGKTAKIRIEIVAFKQKTGESLYSAWERFKGMLEDCPYHNQTKKVLAHTFIEGLHLETKIVVDAAAGGQVLEKSIDEIYVLLNKFSKSNPDWQGEIGRHTVQISAGVLELDVVSALSAQISILTNQVNQMTLVINKQQAQPVQQVQLFCELEEVQSKKRKQVTFNEEPESESEKSKESEKPAEEVVVKQPPPLVVRPPPPYPQRLQKVKDNVAYKKFLDILKQVQINIPLVYILQEVPKYAKYIKDIVENKRRLTEFETVTLTEECSSRIQSKLPQKLKDPGSFTIQISIGKHAVRRVLSDLGASINLMPLSMFKQLGLGEPRPTTVILLLADRSLAHHEGVIEDVLVQVGSFIFPANFIILDYEHD